MKQTLRAASALCILQGHIHQTQRHVNSTAVVVPQLERLQPARACGGATPGAYLHHRGVLRKDSY